MQELGESGLMAVVTRALADTDPNRVVLFDASPYSMVDTMALGQLLYHAFRVLRLRETYIRRRLARRAAPPARRGGRERAVAPRARAPRRARFAGVGISGA